MLEHVLLLCDLISSLIKKPFNISKFPLALVLHGLYGIFGYKSLIEILLHVVHHYLDLVHDKFKRDLVLSANLINDCE